MKPAKYKKHIITNDPDFDLQSEVSVGLFSKARIFKNQRVVSFWDKWIPSLVNPTIEFVKRVGQNPEHYVFELGGISVKTRDEAYSLQEFLSGEKKKPESEEDRAARLKQEEDARRLKEAQALLKGGFYKKSYSGD